MSLISSSVSDMKLILAERGQEMFLFLGKSLWIHTSRAIQLYSDNFSLLHCSFLVTFGYCCSNDNSKGLKALRNISEFSVVLCAHPFDKQSHTSKN